MMDRAVSFFNPVKGLERLETRAKMAFIGEHTGGSPLRRSMRNWFTWESSANAANTGNLRMLRARSRDLVRNTPIALGAINTVVTNVVGEGLSLKSQIDRTLLKLSDAAAEAWEIKAEREFALWAKNPDFTDQLNFDELQALVLRSVLESGDVLVARRRVPKTQTSYQLRLQLIEAERLSNPNLGVNTAKMVDGVVLDGDGKPTAYSICNVHPVDIMPGVTRQWKTYDRGTTATGTPLILHLKDQRRVNQARGVPYLAPVIESLKQLSDYTDAEISAAVLSAMFTVFVTKPDLEDPSVATVGSNDSGSNVDVNTELALGKGAIIDLAAGEKIEIADPKRPNVAAQVFIEAMAKQIGVALELPQEVLLKSFTASYSASRAALEMAWQFFRHRRSWLAAKFCQPVYEWVITEAIVAGRLSAPGFFNDEAVREAWLKSEWIGQSRIQLDPLKEANADLVDINMGTKTREQVMMERTGGTFEAKHAQLVKEETLRRKDGLVTPTSYGAAQQMANEKVVDAEPQPKNPQGAENAN